MFILGDKLYGNIILYIRGQHEVLKVNVIWESNIALGAECRTGTFEIMVRIRVSVRLELGLYIRSWLWLWLELIKTTQNLILEHDS